MSKKKIFGNQFGGPWPPLAPLDPPLIKACLAVQEDLKVVVSLDGKSVPGSQYTDLCKGSLKSMSDLVNLMARLKSWNEEVHSRPLKMSIHMAINSLQDGLERLEDNQSDEY
jgi:hypothetical protein